MESTTVPQADRLARTRFARTAGYYAAFISLGLSTAVLGPTIGGLAANAGVSLEAIAVLFSARSFGYMIGSLRSGGLYDRGYGHLLQAGALLLMAALLSLAPLLPSLWLLVLVFLVLGFGESTVDVGGNILLVWTHGEKVDPYMNALHFFFGVGAFLSPIIIAQAILLSGDFRWAYWMLGLLILPGAAWLARLPSPAARPPVASHAAGRSRPALVLLIALFFFLYVGAEMSFGGWVFTYARALNIADEVTAAYLTSAFWGALTAGRLLSIPLATRLRPRQVLLIDLLGCLVSVAVILLWQGNAVAVWAGSLGMGLAMASAFPTMMTYAERRITIDGKVTGWFLMGGSLGSMSIPWLIGQFFGRFGPQSFAWVILVDLVLLLATYAVLQLVGKGTRAVPA